MRLAVVSAKYPYGPQEAYLDRELRALAPHVSALAVFPTSPPRAEIAYRDIPAQVRRLGLGSRATFAGALTALATRPAASLHAIASVLVARERPRVKLKNLAVLPLGLAAGVTLRRERFDHVHAYWLSTPATVALVAARVAGIPFSSTAHLWDIYERNAIAAKLRGARFVRAISARGRRDLLAAVPGIPDDRVTVLHVGVDVPAQPLAPPLRAPGAPFTVLCAANLVKKKGHADLLRALAAVRGANGGERDAALDGHDGGAPFDKLRVTAGGAPFDKLRVTAAGAPFDELRVTAGGAPFDKLTVTAADVRLVLAGDGELRGELEALARALGVADAVEFRGYVGHDALLDEIRAGRYDAMALTSLELPGGVMEGIPVALMEAMALGLPVITTATGSITELVDDGCGRVVPQGDAAAIAGALRELAGDQALRARLAVAAHRRVQDEFDVVRVAADLARRIRATVHAPAASDTPVSVDAAAAFGTRASVTSEQAAGRRSFEDVRTTETADAAWGQG